MLLVVAVLLLLLSLAGCIPEWELPALPNLKGMKVSAPDTPLPTVLTVTSCAAASSYLARMETRRTSLPSLSTSWCRVTSGWPCGTRRKSTTRRCR